MTLNQGGPPKLKVGSDRARHRGKPDDVDAQAGYYRDPFGAIRSDTVGSFPTAIESVAGETRMLLDASQAA